MSDNLFLGNARLVLLVTIFICINAYINVLCFLEIFPNLNNPFIYVWRRALVVLLFDSKALQLYHYLKINIMCIKNTFTLLLWFAANEFVPQLSFYDLLELWIIKKSYCDEDHPICTQNISLWIIKMKEILWNLWKNVLQLNKFFEMLLVKNKGIMEKLNVSENT